MNILISIKAVINYLYNNIIDLIWVKKVRFEDNSEQLTSSPKLYDIKVLSQAIADKCFAFMCHTVRQDLTKAQVPTLYNDILEKYLNCDKEPVNLTSGMALSYDMRTMSYIEYINDKIYMIILRKLYYSNSYQTGSLTQIPIDKTFKILFAGNNCLIVACLESNPTRTTFYKLNPATNEMTALNMEHPINFDYGGIINFKIIGDKIYFCLTYKKDEAEYDTYHRIFVIEDNLTNFNVTDFYAGDDRACDICFVDNYFYVCVKSGTLVKVKKCSDLNQLNTAPIVWQDDIIFANGYWGLNNNVQIFYDNGRFVLFFKGFQPKFDCVFTDDEFVNISKRQFDLGSDGYGAINFCDGIFYATYQRTSEPHVDPNTRLYYAYINLIENGFLPDTDINDLMPNDGNNVMPTYFLSSRLQLFVISQGFYSETIYYRGITEKIYTDTYNINGVNIPINYYKYQDWKICLADGGTNDTNLASVYAYMGYYPYFVLDTTGETVSLPRNSNLYSAMYVGDKFQDTIDGISGNATRLLAQSENITITGATPTITISANKTYSFDTAITSLTISDVEVSALESVLYFTTGAGTIQFTAPNTLRWGGGNEQPQLEPNTVYCIAIRNGLAEIDNFGSAS